jgi:adenine-specific DNA-methyltransferase
VTKVQRSAASAARRPSDPADVRKARGAFFTPAEVCDYLANWAIRQPYDRVLEPSCGEAAFLTSAVARLRALGSAEIKVDGAEIHSVSAQVARSLVRELGATANVTVGDFMDMPATASYDAVIGNPPFVRYQGLVGEARTSALKAALAQGVVLPKLTNSWAPFVVHSAAQLTPKGRLALVVPAELLSAGFASEVRRFLLRRFERVRLVLSDEALFPGVLTDALLLLAEGSGGCSSLEIVQVRSIAELDDASGVTSWVPASDDSRWVSSLVDPHATTALSKAADRELLGALSNWGRVALGAVTGANGYFALTRERARVLDIDEDELVRISPPGSSHLRAFTFTHQRYRRLAESGQPVLLFRPPTSPSAAARRYIRSGARSGVSDAYKCRVRDPWWRVPLGTVPDLILTYMNGDTPRLAANLAGVHHLNSVHGLYLRPELRKLAVPLAVASLNSATLLGAELVGRAYGGGILKLEPGEALKLPLPTVSLVRENADQLTGLVSRLQRLVSRSGVAAGAKLVDEVVFGAALTPSELAHLRTARELLVRRRTLRGASHRRRPL